MSDVRMCVLGQESKGSRSPTLRGLLMAANADCFFTPQSFPAQKRVQGSEMLPASADSALALKPPPDAVCIVRTPYEVAQQGCTLPVTARGQMEEAALVNGSEKSLEVML